MREEFEEADDARLGHLAVEHKLLTSEELQACIEEQQRLGACGIRSSLTNLMMKLGYVTRSQLRRIRNEGNDEDMVEGRNRSFEWPHPASEIHDSTAAAVKRPISLEELHEFIMRGQELNLPLYKIMAKSGYYTPSEVKQIEQGLDEGPQTSSD